MISDVYPFGPAENSWCTVVVPCYNEADRLEPEAFFGFLASAAANVRFIFVNDGSTDGTLPLLTRMAARDPARIRVLDQQPNAGKGEAVRSGLLMGLEGSRYVAFWDADLATPLASIHDLLAPLGLDPQIQMVFGARVSLLGRNIARSPVRHYVGRVFATAVSAVLRISIYDSQCGAKIFRATPELRDLLVQPFLSRWIFDVEIIARFLALHRQEPERYRRAIYESPLASWTEVPGSKVSPLDFARSLGDLLRIRARYLR